MKVDASIPTRLSSVANAARAIEASGFDGLKVAELNHDPFLPLTIAAEHTDRIELLTSVAVAFARNPMTMAQIAHDLNAYSGGRLVLGLGSQVRPHVERRFSMPWGKPARQMREFISAMQAIFDCWYDGARLDFEGEYYHHNLMPATFTPEDTDGRRPRIILSATGPLMTRVAAETADGMMMHPFSSERYVREVTLPAIEAGLATRGRDLASFDLDYAPMLAVGATDEELETAIARVRDRIAFYGCTVAYRPVLELHGWGELQDELIPLNRAKRTDEMAALITDEIVETIALVGNPDAVVDEMRARFATFITRTGWSVPGLDADHQSELIQRLRAPVD